MNVHVALRFLTCVSIQPGGSITFTVTALQTEPMHRNLYIVPHKKNGEITFTLYNHYLIIG